MNIQIEAACLSDIKSAVAAGQNMIAPLSFSHSLRIAAATYARPSRSQSAMV